MQIDWKFSFDDQVKRYIQTINSVVDGFYQCHRFYLLPFMPEKFRDRVVYLPEIQFKTGKALKKVENSKKFKDEILAVSEKIYLKQKPKLKKLENEFEETKDELIPKLESKFPESKNLHVIISPSLLGSLGSYEFEKEKIVITPRYDRKIGNIWQLLITALTHYCFYNHNLDQKSQIWKKKQLHAAKLHYELGLVDKPYGMVKTLENNFSARLAKKSSKYYKELGYPIKPALLENKLPKNLTKEEDVVIKLMLSRKNELINFDELADAIWNEKSDEKFSLFAITKLIERLRKKIKKAGISANIIHTQRGVGYMLFD